MEKFLKVIFLYVFVLIIISSCWVGLEYVFEGAVHNSDVDGIIAYIFAWFVTDKYCQRINL